MISIARATRRSSSSIVTESGIIHRLQHECPGKEFLCAPVFDVMKRPSDNCRCSECKYMKMNTLEKLRDCMKNLAPRIELPDEILRRARCPSSGCWKFQRVQWKMRVKFGGTRRSKINQTISPHSASWESAAHRQKPRATRRAASAAPDKAWLKCETAPPCRPRRR